ncbi:jg8013 [Pararge aegeria aegeria]|uniref:Jg8013 protein n=1 Tax=Pararge aegeria aegeria TaxID=348720 RepID=A0A8S4RKP2_9NEOP|nr:jg8013 [Pararge aegeria aegeria]
MDQANGPFDAYEEKPRSKSHNQCRYNRAVSREVQCGSAKATLGREAKRAPCRGGPRGGARRSHSAAPKPASHGDQPAPPAAQRAACADHGDHTPAHAHTGYYLSYIILPTPMLQILHRRF